MAAPIGALRAELSASVGQFQADMKKARDAVRQSGRDMQSSFQRITQAGKNVAKSLLSFRTAAVAAAGATAAGLLIKRSLDAADSIDKAAQRAGIAASTLQELRFAFEQQGLAVSVTDGALRRFNRRLGEAQANLRDSETGSKAFRDAFEQAGVSLNQTTGPALEQTIQQLAGIEDDAARAALAARLFGEDAGPALAGALANGAEATSRLREQARELGIVIEDSLIQDAVEARDKLDVLSTVFSKQLTVAVANLAPALTNLFEGLIESLPGIIRQVEQFAQALGLIDELSANSQLALVNDEIDRLTAKLARQERGEIGQGAAAIGSVGDNADATREKLAKLREEQERLKAEIATPDFEGVQVPETPTIPGGGGGGDTSSDLDETGEAASRLESRFASLRDRLDETGAAFRTYREELATLREAYDEGLIPSTEEYRRLQAQLNQAFVEGGANAQVQTEQTRAQKEELDAFGNELGRQLEVLESVKEEADQTGQFFDRAGDSALRFGEDLGNALKDGKLTAEELSSAVLDLGLEIIKASAAAGAFNFGGGGGGGSGFFSSLLGGVTGFLPGFAQGGQFTVGGAGGVDSQLVQFMASPGERVTVETPQQTGGGDGETNLSDRSGAVLERSFRRAIRAEGTTDFADPAGNRR